MEIVTGGCRNELSQASTAHYRPEGPTDVRWAYWLNAGIWRLVDNEDGSKIIVGTVGTVRDIGPHRSGRKLMSG